MSDEVKDGKTEPANEVIKESANEEVKPVLVKQSPEEKAAKVQAAAEARAARALAKESAPAAPVASSDASSETDVTTPAEPKAPSRNQPRLDRVVHLLQESLGADVINESFINERDSDMPYLILKNERWLECARLLKNHAELKLDYLRNVSGTDQETHLEVAYHLVSLTNKEDYCVKIITDRQSPSIPSVASVWATSDWNEREIFDLFGIDFPGHPNMVRIMMPDDWVGHPLRKDYEPLDPEV